MNNQDKNLEQIAVKRMDQIEKQITNIHNKECNTCFVKQFDINLSSQCKTNCVFNDKLIALYKEYKRY